MRQHAAFRSRRFFGASLELASGKSRRQGQRRTEFALSWRAAAQTRELDKHGVQGIALNELHGVEMAARARADVEYRHNVRVVKSRGRAGLSTEPLQAHEVSSSLARQYLQRDMTRQRKLYGFVNHSHSTTADFSQNLVVSENRRNRAVGD